MSTRKTRPNKPTGHGAMARPKKRSTMVPRDRVDPDTIPVVPEIRVMPDRLDDLARWGYSDHEIFAFVIPKRTLMRRRANKQLLSVEETVRVLRLDRLARQAAVVFGDEGKLYRI